MDVAEVVRRVKLHEAGINACRGKHGVILLGDQGSGKSTTISWLLGRPPQRGRSADGKKIIFQILDPLKGLEPGQDQFRSEGVTENVRCFPDTKSELAYIDVPGMETKLITVPHYCCRWFTSAPSSRPPYVHCACLLDRNSKRSWHHCCDASLQDLASALCPQREQSWSEPWWSFQSLYRPDLPHDQDRL